MLQSAVREFTKAKYSHEALRETLNSSDSYDRATWKQLAGGMGIAGIGIPESYGGAGGGLVELGLVLEELGRNLAMTPFFATQLLAINLLLEAGDEESRERYLPLIAAGELTAAVTVGDEPSHLTLEARHTDDGWRLNGTVPWTIDGDTAGVVFALCGTPDGPSWFAVENTAVGFTARHLPTLDPTRALGSIEFRDTIATPIVSTIEPAAVAAKLTDLGAVGLAVEQAGAARGILEMTVEYAKIREQYGRPIGSFQAIKHRCAEMLTLVEAATSTAYYALFSADGQQDDISLAASTAKNYCSEAALHVAGDAIQIHGGIGFTWEHPAHYYFKRAKSATLMFGDSYAHRTRVADAIGL
jgi:alkylation response protein AidB-like acyl-CoA dehydrogenase